MQFASLLLCRCRRVCVDLTSSDLEHGPSGSIFPFGIRYVKMVVDRSSLHYPNVQRCDVVLSGTPSSPSGGGGDSGASGSTPVSMPREVLDAVVPLPPPYSFATGEERMEAVGEGIVAWYYYI